MFEQANDSKKREKPWKVLLILNTSHIFLKKTFGIQKLAMRVKPAAEDENVRKFLSDGELLHRMIKVAGNWAHVSIKWFSLWPFDYFDYAYMVLWEKVLHISGLENATSDLKRNWGDHFFLLLRAPDLFYFQFESELTRGLTEAHQWFSNLRERFWVNK